MYISISHDVRLSDLVAILTMLIARHDLAVTDSKKANTYVATLGVDSTSDLDLDITKTLIIRIGIHLVLQLRSFRSFIPHTCKCIHIRTIYAIQTNKYNSKGTCNTKHTQTINTIPTI